MESNGHRLLPREVARQLLRYDAHCTPLPYGKKGAMRDGWQSDRYEEHDIDRVFREPTNIGILLGAASGNIIDCDLDWHEAALAASVLLPPTGLMWGRDGKPRSHYLYRLVTLDGSRGHDFKDPTLDARAASAESKRHASICQLRVKGQTVAPGSVNRADGHDDYVRFEPNGDQEPAMIEYDALDFAMGHVSAAALVARYWAEGMRHNAAVPLAGLLWHGGMSLDSATLWFRALCLASHEHADGTRDRLQALTDTYRRGEAGQHISGGPTLEDYLDERIVRKLRLWLRLAQDVKAGVTGPDGFGLSDIGNADRFVGMYRNRVRYNARNERWYIYDGTTWNPDDERNQVQELAKEVSRTFTTLVASSRNVSGTGSYEQCVRHAATLASAARIRSMLQLASSDGAIAVAMSEFDSDPLLLNVRNGTLELNIETGEVELREHRADDLVTMCFNAAYVKGARHELFESYLLRFFPEPDRLLYFKTGVGYALTGLPKRYSTSLLGPTNSGKSMTLNIMYKGFGTYAGSLKAENVQVARNGGGDRGRPDLLRIVHKRIVTIAELPVGTTFDTALFKTMHSGGDAVGIRNFFDTSGGTDVVFTCMLWTSGNKPYGLPPGDDAAYERVGVLRCEHTVPEEERDFVLQTRTEDPNVIGEAFLAFAVEGFRILYGEQHGRLTPPEVVKQATRDLRDQLDVWTDTIDALFEFTGDENDGVQKMEAWNAAYEYRTIVENNMHIGTKDKGLFFDAMLRRGAREIRSRARWRNTLAYLRVKWVDPDGHTAPDW